MQEIPYQCTKQINRFQDQFLVANACDSQLLQLLVSDVQQLLAIDLLSFKIFYVLLETVIEAYWEETNKTMHIQNEDNHNSVIHKYRFLGNTSIVTCLDLSWKMCKKCFNLHRITHNTKEKSLYYRFSFYILKHFHTNFKPSWYFLGSQGEGQRSTECDITENLFLMMSQRPKYKFSSWLGTDSSWCSSCRTLQSHTVWLPLISKCFQAQ